MLEEESEMNFQIQKNTMNASSHTLTLAELEAENARLQRLVADLLVKNQHLRVELKAAQRAPSFASRFGTLSMN